MTSAPAQTPIAIVGMAALFPKAPGLKSYWRLLRRGEDAISEVPASHWPADDYYDADPKAPDKVHCRRGGFLSPVDFDPVAFGIPPSVLEATDTAQLLGLVAAQDALADAGYGAGGRQFDRARASVILGVTGTLELVVPLGARLGHPHWRRALAEAGVEPRKIEQIISRISDAYVGWQENSFPGLLGNVVAGRIANRLDLGGTNCVVDAACASSLSAIHLAVLELETGKSDLVLSGGVDTFNDIFMFMCFAKSQALSVSGDARPFSASADGTVLGEGVGILVFKRLADARRDGDRVYAVLRGIGTSSDGRSQSIYAPRAGGQARALRDAYARAGIEQSTIGLIEAHGTGTKVGDVVEFEGLVQAFGDAALAENSCALGSVKSQIGHTKAASGAASLIKAALALYHRTLPGTCKVDAPNPKLHFSGTPFYLNTRTRPWFARDGAARRAGVSSFGFGGSNFHAVLEECPRVEREPAWDGSVEIVALSAATSANLHERLAKLRTAIADGALPAQADASRRSFDPLAPCRLVLVLTADDEPLKVVDRADALLREEATSSWAVGGCAFGAGQPQGKTAFLFPGQGSQYVDMAADLACCFPELHDAIAEADQRHATNLAGCIYPPPTFDAQRQKESAAQLTATDVAQPALGAVSLGLLRVLERFGVRADLACGHSFGELVALRAAGCIDDQALHALARARGRAMAQSSDEPGAMAAVSAPLAELAALLESKHLDVVLANRNAPQQSVISGPQDAIAAASAACAARGWRVTPLPVATAFHSPLMRAAQKLFRPALAQARFAPCAFPVLANATAAAYPADADGIRELLARQIVDPVRFTEQIEHLYAAGVRTFVEVGPKAVLTGLVGRILNDQPHVALAIDASSGRGDGVVDLAKALARLAAAGHAVQLANWEKYAPPASRPKMAVPLVGANYRNPRTDAAAKERLAQTSSGEAVGMAPPPAQLPPVSAIEKTMNPKHPEPSSIPASAPQGDLTGIFQTVQEGLRAMQALQQQTAAAHQQFLDGQQLAHRTFQMVIESQQRLFEKLSGLPVSAASPVPYFPSPVPSEPAVPATPPAPVAAPSPRAAPAAASAPLAPQPAEPSVQAPPPADTSVAPLLISIVAELTGYPQEMLALDMDLEADLGIDSIKRVEILAAVQERMPGLRQVESAHLGSLRTLRDVVDFLQPAPSGAPRGPAAPPARPERAVEHAPSTADHAAILLDVVADLTGYPGEMLALEMDMEADLGIDSIKRVEILAAVQEKLPDLRQVESAHLGSLRTLRDIVQYIAPAATAPAREVQPVNPEAGTISPVAAVSSPQPVPVKNSQLIRRQVLEACALADGETRPLVIAAGYEVWVVDDGTDLARRLVDRFIAQGIAARVVGSAPPVDGEACAPVGGLVHLFPPADRADATTLDQLRSAFVLTRDLAHDLRSAGRQGGALLVTVSRMDGAFGLRGGDFDPVQGGLAGLVKTAACEWPEVVCRALDVDRAWENSDEIADAVMAAICVEGPIEIGLGAGARSTLRLVERPARPASTRLEPGDLVIVSGGARGVTAEAVCAMARAYRPTLVLLGRSPEPEPDPEWARDVDDPAALKRAIMQHQFAGAKPSPSELEAAFRRLVTAREIARNLEQICGAGSNALYRSVDVTDRSAVKSLVRELRDAFGPVRGIIHGAGVIEDRLIVDKDNDGFDRVMNTKVVGLQALLDAVGADDLKCLVVFSSVTGRFGRKGQVDYAMANEALNKISQRQAARRPHCRVVAVNWGPWDGGMVGAALKKVFEREGIGLIPLAAGAEALVDEISERDPSAIEVVIGSTCAVENPQSALSAAHVVEDLEVVLTRRLEPASHAFLNGHVIGGKPVLPVAIGIEWLAHAALHAHPGMKLVAIEDLRVLKGVALESAAVDVELAAGSAEPGPQGLRVAVELRTRDAHGSTRVNYRARSVLAVRYASAPGPAPAARSAGQPAALAVETVYRDMLFHHRPFHALTAVNFCAASGICARLQSAPAPDQWMEAPPRSAWIADPLLIDGALQLGIVWTIVNLHAPALPAAIGAYHQFVDRLPAAGARATLVVKEQSAHRLVADVDLLDERGDLVARLVGVVWAVDAGLARAFSNRRAEQHVRK